ncbi:MAG: DNA-binding transcriptional repressor DeoR [Pantoea dispersa]
METRRDERINKLAQALKHSDTLHLKQAAQLLGVSEMTIRRDLTGATQGVVLLGGYVMRDPRQNVAHYFVSDQQNLNVSKKRLLAQRAAALVQANDTVFFDCGTTLPLVIEAIDNDLPFTAICSAINTFLALKEKPRCRVILCGGEFHADNAVFTPLEQVTVLDALCPKKAFISAAGMDAAQGATCYNLNELPIKHLALQRAQTKIVVGDSSKYGKVLPARIGDFSLFDMLVSDSPPPPALLAVLQAARLTLHCG